MNSKALDIAVISKGNMSKLFLHYMKDSVISYEINSIVYFDDSVKSSSEVILPFNEFDDEIHLKKSYLVCLGYNYLELKKRMIDSLLLKKSHLIKIIHTNSYCAPSALIGEGVVLTPMSCVDHFTKIGNATILGNGSVLAHDSEIGDCCYVSTGVNINGNVKIGDSCFIGSGATILDGLTIGNNVQIAANSIVKKDIPDSHSFIGGRLLVQKINI